MPLLTVDISFLFLSIEIGLLIIRQQRLARERASDIAEGDEGGGGCSSIFVVAIAFGVALDVFSVAFE